MQKIKATEIHVCELSMGLAKLHFDKIMSVLKQELLVHSRCCGLKYNQFWSHFFLNWFNFYFLLSCIHYHNLEKWQIKLKPIRKVTFLRPIPLAGEASENNLVSLLAGYPQPGTFNFHTRAWVLFPHRLIFTTNLKRPLVNNSRIANQRTAMTMTALRHFPVPFAAVFWMSRSVTPK